MNYLHNRESDQDTWNSKTMKVLEILVYFTVNSK